jgi:hypothetical protein
MKIAVILYLVLLSGWSCAQDPKSAQPLSNQPPSDSLSIDTFLYQRFAPPMGFRRTQVVESTFGAYLRRLPLKPPGSTVMRYDRSIKVNSDVYDAVVDLPIGNKDLHQCADAVMRLRAEYLWTTQQYDKIHFNLTNGFRVDYSRWKSGERVVVKGNNTTWVKTADTSVTYTSFWKYLEFVFTYAGTLSLSKELQPVQPANMQIGDVFIRGGSPGHAVIVVDMAVDPTGKKLFMLAQSYMPAQEIQILKNTMDSGISPWYLMEEKGILKTPEWDFEWGQLKRF